MAVSALIARNCIPLQRSFCNSIYPVSQLLLTEPLLLTSSPKIFSKRHKIFLSKNLKTSSVLTIFAGHRDNYVKSGRTKKSPSSGYDSCLLFLIRQATKHCYIASYRGGFKSLRNARKGRLPNVKRQVI